MVSVTAPESRLGQYLGLRAANAHILNENEDEGLEEMRKPMTNRIHGCRERKHVCAWVSRCSRAWNDNIFEFYSTLQSH